VVEAVKAVSVQHRRNAFMGAKGFRVGSLLYMDEVHLTNSGPRRLFWLLDYGVQLVYEPFGWSNEWYVDLVEITLAGTADAPVYHVRDMAIDIVVEGMGPTYRIIDLDEFGAAITSGVITATEAQDVLRRTQSFLDAFLHRDAPWPPPQVVPLFSPTHVYP